MRENGVRVVSATESITDTPEGIILESVIEGYNEYYSAELAQKVTRGLKESRNKGQFTGGRCIFGYKIVDKKYTIDETESIIVKEIFTRVIHGEMLKDIAQDLNNRGIRKNNNADWNGNYITKLINNEKYIGKATYNGVTYTNIVPAIIDEEIFKKVKDSTSLNKHRHPVYRDPVTFLLANKVECMNCHSPINGDSGTSKTGRVYNYYTCRGRKDSKDNCSKKSINKQMLEDLVVDKTIQYMFEPKYMITLANQMVELYNETFTNKDEIKIYETTLNKIEKEIKNTLNAIKQGVFNSSVKQMLDDLEIEKENISTKILKLKNQITTNISVGECTDFLYSLTLLDYSKEENKKLLIDRFVKRVYLSDETFRIEFYPIDKAFVTKKDGPVGGNNGNNGGNTTNSGSEGTNYEHISNEFQEIASSSPRSALCPP